MAGADGRNIDPSLGDLSGEGAQQRHRGADFSENAGLPVYKSIPGVAKDDPTYYDRPLLKKSPWAWDIPAYYYVGGASGASVAFGAAAQVLNPDDLKRIVARARTIGILGSLVSGYFLIHDLGRPERFLYMMRVFRPTSPMSVGVYILSVFASANGLAWMSMWVPGPLRAIGNAAGLVAGLFGLGMAGYTAVLVSNTAVPLWYVPRRLTPFLFLASGAASAASLFELMDLNETEAGALKTFSMVGKAAEFVCMELVQRETAAVPQVERHFREGFGGALWQTGKVVALASALLSIIPRKSRALRVVSGLLGTTAALCVRFGIHYAGQRCATDPRASFHQQRSRGLR